MLNLLKSNVSPEELFARNYKRLLGWSLHLTGGDQPLAEDLLHDVYVLFHLQKVDPSSIVNLDAYLYTMLRNLHISRLRRAASARLRQLSILEFDSAERGLITLPAHERILLQEQLRAACLHACERKEKAKSACAFILRFFHGYYPSEAARVLKTTRSAIDLHLMRARNEAKLAIENPTPARHAKEPSRVAFIPAGFARRDEDFLGELRRMIFASSGGECLTGERLKALYLNGDDAEPKQSEFSHLVSCPVCLDEVNDLLKLPPLSERHPEDSVKREPPNGGSGGGSAGGPPIEKLKAMRRRAGEIHEHQPQELCVSVNGYERGSQRVSSGTCELNLVVDAAEPISFVEVFSEQDVRMLMLPVTPPPAGEGEQWAGVGFSDGRSLSLRLKFRSPWPTLQVLYNDPTFHASPQPSAESSAIVPAVEESEQVTTPVGDALKGLRLYGRRTRILRTLFGRGFWLRPAVVTLMLGVMLTALLLAWRAQLSPPVSAAELLGRAARVEEVADADALTVQYRTIQLEEWRGAGRPTVTRRRVEIWKGGAKGVTARRLFDERGRLLAGEWRGPDGSRTFYRASRAGAPQNDSHATQPDDGSASRWSLDGVWQFEPSAEEFAALVVRPDEARAEELRDHFSVTYEAEAGDAATGLVSASLLLERRSLHAFEQELTARVGGEVVRFRFIETAYERRPKDSVAPRVFVPDEEFVKTVSVSVETPAADGDARPKTSTADANGAGVTAATAALEVEVLSLLNRTGADLGEQVNVVRTPDGLLRVQAVAENSQRRDELLRALAPVMKEPSFRIEIVDNEAEYNSRGRLATPDTVRRVETAGDDVPAGEEVRRYLARGGKSGDALEADALSFTARVSSRARSALQHAWALKRLAEKFSPKELNELDGGARAKWLALLREHASAVSRDAATLRRELQPVFYNGVALTNADPSHAPETEADFAASAERLLEMCSSFDTVVRSAFTASSDRSAAAGVRSPQFWRSLRSAEALAEEIRRAAERLDEAPRVNR